MLNNLTNYYANCYKKINMFLFIVTSVFLCVCFSTKAFSNESLSTNDKLFLDTFINLCLNQKFDENYTTRLQIEHNAKIKKINTNEQSTLAIMHLETLSSYVGVKKKNINESTSIAYSLGGSVDNSNNIIAKLSSIIKISDIIKASTTGGLREIILKESSTNKANEHSYIIVQSIEKGIINHKNPNNIIVTHLQGNLLSNEVIIFKEEILPLFFN